MPNSFELQSVSVMCCGSVARFVVKKDQHECIEDYFSLAFYCAILLLDPEQETQHRIN